MDCAEEVDLLKREVAPVVGGEEKLNFDIIHGWMIVQAETGSAATEQILQAVARTGMRAEIWDGGGKSATKTIWQRHSRLILTTASGVFTLAGFILHVAIAGSIRMALGSEGMGIGPAIPMPAILLYGVGILTGVWYVFPKAVLAARRLRPNMNLLMTLAVAGAIFLGEWLEAGTVSFLFALSLLLESWSVGRARRAVESLLESVPSEVRIRTADGSEESVRPEDVAVGATFIVNPGEKIALDGHVIRGTSEVNQAPITGESIPVAKQEGEEVFAGTINGNGSLEIRSSKPADQTTLSNIIRLITEAQSRRAPSEQWVEKFARIYTPIVMALAVTVFLLPPLFLGGSWNDWLYRALVLLVIGCPCALVISTPVSIVAALTSAAHTGVLVKGGAYMESPAHLKAIAMDKTGTLTEGRPVVVRLIALSGHDEEGLLLRAAALEARSDHPLARAIITEAENRGLAIVPADDFNAIPGKGAVGQVNGEGYWIGSHRYFEERGQETSELHEQLLVMADAGQTAVIIGNDTHVCGIIGLADKIRPQAKKAIKTLRDTGVGHIVMITGDNHPTAMSIARELGITEVKAELLPAEKVEIVESLVQQFGQVAMVGDGVNDAPAMARATVGIAMGAIGTDAAIETADIALMSDDLSKLPWLIRHSRRTLSIIRQNIVLSLAVKVVFVILTLVGYASLWAAIAADMGASLFVIFNGLRLLRTSHHF